jgi:hypothetical protein
MSAPPHDLPHYARWERFLLWTLAATGLLLVNGAFLYGVFFDPGAMAEAMDNPVSLAFQVEAFLLLAALAWLLPKWGVTRIRRGWFVALGLLGSLAFALPVALLWGGRPYD